MRKNIKEDNINDKIDIDKNFDFNKFNIKYYYIIL